MCGICGIVHRDDAPVDRIALEQMRDAMAYRGPDGAGLYLADGVGLGHRRLAIIDLATGDQPMSNDDGSCHIVFNGEIYNYIELRDACISAGQTFRTQSDTEVILRLYERLGDECVTQLNGMFTFAIWDTRRRELFVARDRVGVKPLYYTMRDGTFLFASELKALLQHPLVPARIQPSAIDEFLTYGYVQTPGTICEGIFRVPEGHVLRWRNGHVTIKQYWDLTFAPEPGPEKEHEERVLALLKDSVRLRLRSDVPVGVFLSGGVDSSAVATLLANATGRIKTFSIGFDAGPEYTELQDARWLATRLGSDHHELVLDARTFRSFIPDFAYYMDEPVSEAPAIPLFFVSKLAARSVKVVLSGEGADEAFGGYPTYARVPWLERLHAMPAWLRSPRLAALASAANGARRAEKYLYLASEPLERRYLSPHLFDPRDRGLLYRPEFGSGLGGFDAIDRIAPIYARTRQWDLLSRMLYLDTKTWLPNDILIKSDRMSMANSIELRVPFLDYRLLEYAARIPSALKVRGRQTKYLLKRALGSVVPAAVLERRKKGFPTPVAGMLRNELSGYARELLLDARAVARGYFEPAVVERLLREHVAGSADHHGLLWRLIVLEQWHREYIDLATARQQRAAHAAPVAAVSVS